MTKALSFLHFLYVGVVSLLIFTSLILAQKSTGSFIALILLTPLLFHFLFETYRRLYFWQYRLKNPLPPIEADTNFSFYHFLTQENPTFLVSLSLLIIYLTLALLKSMFNL